MGRAAVVATVCMATQAWPELLGEREWACKWVAKHQRLPGHNRTAGLHGSR